VTIPTVGPTLATMIGLGVGIDYALFLVTKHRDLLAQGVERHESIARAVATSGGAIVFAGGTVVIALLSLWVADIPLVASLGYASAVAVLTAVLAAVTLLPATRCGWPPWTPSTANWSPTAWSTAMTPPPPPTTPWQPCDRCRPWPRSSGPGPS
jgi:uncharacterized membrane protein YdfJ with MMPL/SSD domain